MQSLFMRFRNASQHPNVNLRINVTLCHSRFKEIIFLPIRARKLIAVKALFYFFIYNDIDLSIILHINYIY